MIKIKTYIYNGKPNEVNKTLQENAEYAVNNVKYQVSASFQTPDDKIPAEDFADKLKRLILSEDIMNRNGKK